MAFGSFDSGQGTGRPMAEQDEVHLWHFDAQGRVARFAHRCDTWGHAAALRPAEATAEPA